jgi:hypothetical protein
VYALGPRDWTGSLASCNGGRVWRSRLPLGLLVVVASCQPTGDGTDPLGELPPISDFPRSGENSSVNPVVSGSSADGVPEPSAPPSAAADPRTPGGGATTVSPVTTPPSNGSGSPQGAMDAGASSGGTGGGAQPPPDAAPDAGAVDAGQPDASGEGGCPRLLAPDAGVCSAYGCSLSLDQLRSTANSAGACTSPAALAAACDGSASSAALRCTEASVFSVDLSETASACVQRDPQLSPLGATCLGCFVDEALCTLSRCFALCALASENDECRTCRRQQCGSALTQCTGLPAP